MSDAAEKLWTEYFRRRARAAHKALMEHYIYIVRFHASRYIVSRRLQECDEDELVNDGMFGLAAAIRRFDPEQGVKFETYVTMAVKGAILDGVRRHDRIPRQARRRSTAMDASRRKFFEQYGRKPGDDELLAWMKVPRKLRDNHLCSDKFAKTTNLEQYVNRDGEHHDTNDEDAVDPTFLARSNEVKDYVLSLLVSDQLREIANLYYYGKMTMKEIGQKIGLCETRVSQLHGRIVAIWKARIEDESRLNP